MMRASSLDMAGAELDEVDESEAVERVRDEEVDAICVDMNGDGWPACIQYLFNDITTCIPRASGI